MNLLTGDIKRLELPLYKMLTRTLKLDVSRLSGTEVAILIGNLGEFSIDNVTDGHFHYHRNNLH
jgi:hypothetical protein